MKKKISKKDILDIVNLYKTNLTTRDIAKIYGITHSYVFKLLKNNNYEKKSQHIIKNKKYSINKDFFITDSWQLAYVMGFALADGHIVENKYSSILSFYIHLNDKIILDKIKEFSGATHPIFISKNKPNMAEISISDSIFKNNLKKWGIVPYKTYNPVIPQVPFELLKPFLIGFIDGDGSLRFDNKKQFSIVGNNILMDFFIEAMKRIGFSPEWKIYTKNNKIWKHVKLYKKNEILKLVEILNPKKYYFLNRKWHNIISELEKSKNGS